MHINPILDIINKSRCLGSSNQCYDVMYAVTRAFQVKTVVEIGTHRGASAIVFCQAVLDNGEIPKVYTVDSWVQADVKQIAYGYFQEAGFLEHIEMIEGDSKIVVPKLLATIGKVDLILIDGDHAYESITQDYENCKNSTDLIFFHDTGFGKLSYLQQVVQEGWNVLSFPTKYAEGDGHIVGITLARR